MCVVSPRRKAPGPTADIGETTGARRTRRASVRRRSRIRPREAEPEGKWTLAVATGGERHAVGLHRGLGSTVGHFGGERGVRGQHCWPTPVGTTSHPPKRR